MKKILITGAKGQLGMEIQQIQHFFTDYEFIFTDIEELDISDTLQIENFFSTKRPDYLVNCAAYTAVDKAESDSELAFLLNSTSCGYLADACTNFNCKMIHISTDFVFNGKSSIPYVETDPADPVSVYGKSKLEGEKLLIQKLTDFAIIRTAWLYSSYGNNFVKTMLKYGRERGLLKVVNDQIGSPTYAADLAEVIMLMIRNDLKARGIFHYSNEGRISWYDFAVKIIELSDINCEVLPILSSEFKSAAKRPEFSLLDKSRILKEYPVKIPYWTESLEKCIQLLLNENYERI